MEYTGTARVKTALLLFALTGLLAGIILYFSGKSNLATIAWFVAACGVARSGSTSSRLCR